MICNSLICEIELVIRSVCIPAADIICRTVGVAHHMEISGYICLCICCNASLCPENAVSELIKNRYAFCIYSESNMQVIKALEIKEIFFSVLDHICGSAVIVGNNRVNRGIGFWYLYPVASVGLCRVKYGQLIALCSRIRPCCFTFICSNGKVIT